jgi:hypothetical protein
MADIASVAEVLAAAFTRPIATARIPAGMVNAVQVKYILPLLGEEFYDDVILTPASYTTLLVYLKPIVAYFVKFTILPDIFVEVSNTGGNKVPGNNRTAGTTEDLGSMRQSTLDTANLYVKALTKYLDDNEALYPLYDKDNNPDNNICFAGGLIIRNEVDNDFINEDN